jgi:hypothetical protein
MTRMETVVGQEAVVKVELEKRTERQSVEQKRNYTVRELIASLLNSEDMDKIVYLSFYNSDPVPIAAVDETAEDQIVLRD